ncbi:MAG: hypothetical protein VR65_06195 [Desulfobulbaceae bacterium BRH_c16a]|nr:MAG: hypothetical protein VR65_06195 [Desulfobulbaceae bacterium BRH_c16a]
MSEEPQYDRETLREISRLYQEAERAIKYVEDFDGVLTVPAINQLRYAGNHLIRYLAENKQDELRDALKHVKRATYDAYEATIVYQLLEYDKFKNDYRMISISKVLPDYVQLQEKIETARLFVRENDQSKTRGDNYRNGKEHLDQIVCSVRLLNTSREELNKLIVSERNEFLWKVLAGIGVIATVVGIIIATL